MTGDTLSALMDIATRPVNSPDSPAQAASAAMTYAGLLEAAVRQGHESAGRHCANLLSTALVAASQLGLTGDDLAQLIDPKIGGLSKAVGPGDTHEP